ncbi:transcription termination factor 1-like isoform X2 [Heterodontus francisci]
MIEESSSMMRDVVHKEKKKWKHSDKTRKRSSRSLEDDVPEAAIVETDQEVQILRLAGHGEKKQKKSKKDRSASLGGYDSSETVTVDTEQDVQNLLFVGNSEKKRKKKKKEKHNSRSEGECEISEVQSPRSAGHSEKKQKKKKKDRSISLGGCGTSETLMLNTEQDLQNLQFVGNNEKEWKKKKKERHSSRLEEECDNSEMRNPRLAGHSENKRKKKKKNHSISLGGCDISETVMLETEQDLQNLQFVCNNEKEWKKKKKERHSSRSEGECDNSEVRNLRLVGNGDKKKKHHPRIQEANVATQVSSTEIKKETQHSGLMGNEGNQTSKKDHHSCSADEPGVPASAVKTKQTLQCARLEDCGDKNMDHVKAVKDGKHHCRSAEGGNDSKTTAKVPHQESEMSESADIDIETSTKKCKKKKKKHFEDNINRDASLNDSEIPQKSIKKCKISSVLPFETIMEENCHADLVESLDESFKKHKVKCSSGGIAETDYSKAVNISNFAAITALQTEQIMHNSSIGCQEAVKTSKRCKRKKGTVSRCKKSGRTKNLMQDRPVQSSALNSENTLEVVMTPKTISEPSKRLETRKRQKKKQQKHMTESDNNDGSTVVEDFQEEEVPFSQDTTKVRMMEKSKLVELLKDFIPNVQKLTTETMYSMYKYDLPRFQRFREEGVPIRRGRFTKEENQQLQKNLRELLELTGIQNEWEFFHVPESFDEMMRIKRLKMNNLFCCRLAEGIPRPWKCVYQRAKKMYDPNRCKGRYTEEELEKLKRLQIVHGNHWKQIAKLMDRSDVSVIGRAKTIKNSLNIGSWTKKEERKLMKIMEEVMKNKIQEASRDLMTTASNTNMLVSILREKLYKGIPWFAIADQMEHRNWMQCRQKWMNILTTKMSGGVKPFGFNNYQSKINLIKRLYLLSVDDVGDVDWEDLCSAVGDVPPIFIQRMFYKLKTRYVPDWSRKSFGGIVDFLYDQILPKLEAVLQKKKDQGNWIGENGLYQPQQREFKLSDIFDDDDEDEEDEIEKMHPLEEHSGTSLQISVGETN